MIIYVIRHGQTDWNLQGRIQGQTDIPLNDKGRAQGRELKNQFAGINFAQCFSSDLQRTSETARIIVGDRQIEIIRDKRLRERNFYDLEGKPSAAYTNICPQDLDKIESDQALSQRIFQFLNEALTHKLNKSILIVTHGGVIRAILSKILLLKCPHAEIRVGNMAMMKLLFTNGQWNIQEIHDIQWPD